MIRQGIIIVLAVLLSACSAPVVSDGKAQPKLTIHSSLIIPTQQVDGVGITELSALAWDQDEQLLYALSDKGRLYHFRLKLDGNRLLEAKPVFATYLEDVKGRHVKKHRRDSEGLLVIRGRNGKRGDSQLILSFEGSPRVIRFTPHGRAIKNIHLPRELRSAARFQTGNDSLEAVTYHSRYGYMTAPETPLKDQPRNLHTLYSMKGRKWSFMAYPAKNSGITALEALPNGDLLILERAWSGITKPLTISLRYLDFSKCSKQGACEVQNLKVLRSHFFMDNFEGLTRLQGNQYLMVSDDAGGGLLRSNLTLFTLDLME